MYDKENSNSKHTEKVYCFCSHWLQELVVLVTEEGVSVKLNEALKKARARYYPTAKDFVLSFNETLKKENRSEYTIAYPTYAAYEKGAREPRLDQLVEIARHLNVSLDDLLEYTPAADDFEIKLQLEKLFLQDEKFLSGKHLWDESKYIGIRTLAGGAMLIDKNECRRILKAAEKYRQDSIEVQFKELLNHARQEHSEEYALNAVSVIGRAAAEGLGLDYDAFVNELGQLQFTHPLLNTPLNALCFYYFTGINPAANPHWTSQVIDAFETVTQTGTAALAQISVTHKKALEQALFQYLPGQKIPCSDKARTASASLPRLGFLEEYIAQINNLDYRKFIRKFNDHQALQNLKQLYLMFYDGMHSKISIAVQISKYSRWNQDSYYETFYDVATPKGRKHFDMLRKLSREQTNPHPAAKRAREKGRER